MSDRLATLRSLAARLEAGETGREIDADIAIALGHKIEWKQRNYTMETFAVITWSDGMREPCLAFTDSLDAAAVLVERLFPEDRWKVGRVSPRIRVPEYEKEFYASVASSRLVEADSSAAALVLAMVRALMAREELGES